MGSGISSIPMHIDKETFRKLSGGTLNDAIFEANSVGGVMTRDKLLELAQMRDCFISFDKTKDMYGRNVLERVNRIGQYLKSKGLMVWFEEFSGKPDARVNEVCGGIDKSRSVVCFMTKSYIDKVCGSNPADLCYMEFNYTLRRKHPDHMVPVVLEEPLLNTAAWSGVVGVALGSSTPVDFVNDEGFEAKCEELYQRIIKISKHADNLFAPELVTHHSILSQTDKSKEEQQFFQWLARSTNIDESRRIMYCASFVKAGVSSVFVLAKMMKAMPNFLTTIGVNEADADQIALAVRDLGLGYNPVRNFDQALTIESVIFAMRKASSAAEDPTLAESALSCAARVAASNRIMPTVMNDAGICEAILKLLQRNLAHGPSMEYGCLAIHNMIVNNPEISAKLGTLSTCDILPRTIRSHLDNAVVVHNGSMAIAVMAKNAENRERLTFTGSCDVVVRAMFKHIRDADVIEQCCYAANTLSVHHFENVSKLGIAGGCEALTQAINLHSGHSRFVEQAFQVMNTLAIEPINREKCGTAECCAGIVKALTQQLQQEYLPALVHGCNATNTIITGSAYNRTALGKAGACEAVKAIILKYPTDLQLMTVASKAVFALAAGNLEHKNKFNGIQGILQQLVNGRDVPPEVKKEAKEALLKVQ